MTFRKVKFIPKEEPKKDPGAPSFWLALWSFVRRLEYRKGERRGYSTNGNQIRINGHLIAEWDQGAVRMFLNDPQWHPLMVAQAIVKIRDACEEQGVLAGRHEVICKEHVDCHKHEELGKACAQARFSVRKPKPLPYFEAQTEARRIKVRKSKT